MGYDGTSLGLYWDFAHLPMVQDFFHPQYQVSFGCEMPMQSLSMEIICGVCPKILCETNLRLKSRWSAVEQEPHYSVPSGNLI